MSMGILVYLLGIPSALSGGTGFFGAGLKETIGMSWFDAADYLTNNWLLPLGGIGISLFVGWQWNQEQKINEFKAGSQLGSATWLYSSWLKILRWLCPLVIILIMLYNLQVL